ncbi:MAG TPA: hypothetical protein VI306_24465 [Pyrinomonadaceae bacterium]
MSDPTFDNLITAPAIPTVVSLELQYLSDSLITAVVRFGISIALTYVDATWPTLSEIGLTAGASRNTRSRRNN